MNHSSPSSAKAPTKVPSDNTPSTASPCPFKSDSFLQSLGFAWTGLKLVFQTERNFQTHAGLTVLTVLAGFWLEISQQEWTVIILCITVMLAVEILNTAIENLVDMLAGECYHTQAKRVKDIAAAACLLTAIGMALIGALVFGPHLLAKWPIGLLK